jgi:YidC/Oxa1 family membrane protein insertase
MPSFYGVPVDAAYHVVSALATALAPITGGLAVVAAIVAFTIGVRLLLLPFSYYALRGQTAQGRLAPQVQALRKRHAKDPERLKRELATLYEKNGTSMYAGCLPVLLQWPFLSIMYLLFRSATIEGAPNHLLSHYLFGAQLGSHWLGGAGPLSAQGAVFAGLFVLLAAVGWLSARVARRMSPPPEPASAAPGKSAATGKTVAGKAVAGKAAAGQPPARRQASRQQAATSAAQPAALPSWLTSVVPFVTVVIAAFLPLAAGLYLLTTTAWTMLERRVLFPRLRPPAPPVPEAPAAGPARGGQKKVGSGR